MRILHLTAGTGCWHCGSCIRDDTLVGALGRLGHEARLVPMYLPIVADRDGCSDHEPVLMGGIQTYLEQELPWFRHLPRWVDGVLSARPLLNMAGRLAGSTRPEQLGALTVSMLRGEDGHQAREVGRLLANLERGARPDVVVLSNSLLVGLVEPLQRRLGVPVVTTVQGELHFLDALEEGADEAWELVGQGLAASDARVAVSGFAAAAMAQRTGLRRSAFDVVPNGIDVRGYGPPRPDPDAPRLGYLGRLYGPKGLHHVVEAFVQLAASYPTLTLGLAGAQAPGDGAELDRALARVREAGLADRVDARPNVSLADKQAFLASLTVFTVPAAKDDTSAMYNLEAMASGVPVVAPDRGAIPETVGALGGGVLVPPDDVAATVSAVAALLDDPKRREALGRAGAEGVRNRFTDAHMAEGVAAVAARVRQAEAA